MLIEAENGFWQQRSRSNWLMWGDRNTAYFHYHASHCHHVNAIRRIRDTMGNFVKSQKEISEVVVSYFSTLFQSDYDNVSLDELFHGIQFPSLSSIEKADMG